MKPVALGATDRTWSVAALQQLEERLRSLMISALAGHEQPYRQLLMDIANRLRTYFSRRLGRENADVEDLVQETLLAIHQRRFTYDIGRPFTAWLHAIARYKLIDHRRRSNSAVSIPIDDMDELFVSDASEAAAARVDVEQLLDELPSQARGYIRAVKIDGKSISEVSTSHGVSESAVKVAIHRGIKTLALRLKGTDTP
jgi:RNA polymerase sigma-70 factor (ECF subfamily)